MPLIIQDLLAGRDVLVIEVSGDLGTYAEAHARARGVEVLKVDASDPWALAFNPIYATSNQKAGQKAAAAMKAVATDHPHYSSMNQNLARYFTILARDYKRYHGLDPNEANLADVRHFVLHNDHLRKVLGAYEADDKKTYIDAPWLSDEAGEWIEQSYLRWRPDYRETTVSGFIAYLNNLLSADAARATLCPDPEKAVLDLSHEVSDNAMEPPLPGQTGRLIVMRFPIEVLDPDPASDTAYWALKTVIDSTLAGRSESSTPMSVICDELPTLIGDASSAALKDFQLWITNIRKYQVAVHVAYQGWALLPEILTGTLTSNGRNVLISGGMSGQDAKRAQQMLGSDLEEDISENEELGRANRRRSRRVSVKENPRYSVGEIQKIPRGQWWLLRQHRSNYREPIVIRVPMAKLPKDTDRRPTALEVAKMEARANSEPTDEHSPEERNLEAALSVLGRPGETEDDAQGDPEVSGQQPSRYTLPGYSNAVKPDRDDSADNEEGERPDAEETRTTVRSGNTTATREPFVMDRRKGGG